MAHPIFARHSLAESYAISLAQKLSTTGRAAFVPFTDNKVIRPEDKTEPNYTVRPCCDGRSPDYELRELTPEQVNEIVRRGMLRAADKLEEEAAGNEAEADDLRVSGKQRQRMDRLRKDADAARAQAEALRASVTRGTFVDLLASCGPSGDEKALGAA